jgi:hypothetical protein
MYVFGIALARDRYAFGIALARLRHLWAHHCTTISAPVGLGAIGVSASGDLPQKK